MEICKGAGRYKIFKSLHQERKKEQEKIMEVAQRIINLFEHQEGERLIWSGSLPNGKKRQIWQDQK